MNYVKDQDIFIKKSNEKVICLIHGIFASHHQFQAWIDFFLDLDYSIYAVSLKGHGQSHKEIHTVSHRDWINQINDIFKDLTQKFSNVYVIAHSLGALLTIQSSHVEQIKKVVLWAPAFKQKVTLRSMYLSIFSERKHTKNDVLLKYQALSGVRFDSMHHKLYAIKPLVELRKVVNLSKKSLKSFSCDALIIQSKGDETIRLKSGTYTYNHIASKNKQLLLLKKSYHTVLDLKENIEVLSAIKLFFNS